MGEKEGQELNHLNHSENPSNKDCAPTKIESKDEHEPMEDASQGKNLACRLRPDEPAVEPPLKKIKCEAGVEEVFGEDSRKGQHDLNSKETNVGQTLESLNSSNTDSRSNGGVIEKQENVSSTTEAQKNVSWERKKKVALLISYCGAGYFGMQKNPGVNTIEDELIDALHKAGTIKTCVKDDLGKMSFQRCARTDKGVSAASQVVSLKMVPDEKLLPAINQHLPPSIRVFGMKRVTKGFDSKLQCSARTYQYLLPTFSFAPTEILSVPSYRIKPDQIDNINDTLQILCGTHNFHNFTSGKSPNDASSKRYIMKFTAGEPFVKKGYEFITLSVKGQSFMLHQIRKMIGLCIAICRGYCGTDVIEKAWGKNKVDIPKAPGLGLILNEVHYDRYNEKYGSDGIHEPISWKEHEEEVMEFKNSFIWDTIIESEITQKSMLKWLYTLNNHTYTENRNQELQQSAKS